MENLHELLDRMNALIKSGGNPGGTTGLEFKFGEFTCCPIMASKPSSKKAKKMVGKNMPDVINGNSTKPTTTPIGFLVTRGNEIQFIPTHSPKILAAIMENIPNIMEKFTNKERKFA